METDVLEQAQQYSDAAFELCSGDLQALRDRIERLERSPCRCTAVGAHTVLPRSAAPAPGVVHSTKLLRELEAARERWWFLYDKDDPTTSPTNIQVTAWLQSRGVAKRISEAMATILRADGLPPGRRPEI